MAVWMAWLALGAASVQASSATASDVSSDHGAALPEQRLTGKVFLTMEEALKLAFPGCQIERTTAYLSETQQKAIEKACGGPFADRVVYPYLAKKDGKVVGTAYFDTHNVRSLRQTLMVVITPDQKVKRVELLAFAEPRQYLPKPKWLQQFHGQTLTKDLRIGGAIRPMSGATLTANASLACSKRILALHAALQPKPKVSKPKESKGSDEKPGAKPKVKTPEKAKPKEAPKPAPQKGLEKGVPKRSGDQGSETKGHPAARGQPHGTTTA